LYARESLGLAYHLRLVVIAYDNRDDQRLRLLGWLLDYDLRLLDDLRLLVDWLLRDLRVEVMGLQTHVKH
jgi:hypothetical protein